MMPGAPGMSCRAFFSMLTQARRFDAAARLNGISAVGHVIVTAMLFSRAGAARRRTHAMPQLLYASAMRKRATFRFSRLSFLPIILRRLMPPLHLFFRAAMR